MDIGIIGAGNIGGTLGRLLVKAGYSVRFGVRNVSKCADLLAEFGPKATAGSSAEAAAFGEAVIFAGPFGAWPEFAAEMHETLAGKVVIDAANPYPSRDGAIAETVIASGAGSALYVARLLPRTHLIKAFNSIYWIDLRDQAARDGERLAMPIAGDDLSALALTGQLATDIGFDPVVVGGLASSIDLDPGSTIYAKSMTAVQVRNTLGLAG